MWIHINISISCGAQLRAASKDQKLLVANGYDYHRLVCIHKRFLILSLLCTYYLTISISGHQHFTLLPVMPRIPFGRDTATKLGLRLLVLRHLQFRGWLLWCCSWHSPVYLWTPVWDQLVISFGRFGGLKVTAHTTDTETFLGPADSAEFMRLALPELLLIVDAIHPDPLSGSRAGTSRIAAYKFWLRPIKAKLCFVVEIRWLCSNTYTKILAGTGQIVLNSKCSNIFLINAFFPQAMWNFWAWRA